MSTLYFFMSALFFGWAVFFIYVIKGDPVIVPMNHPAMPLTIVVFIASGIFAIAGALA